MIIAGRYSFNGGEEYIQAHYPHLLKEVEESILSKNRGKFPQFVLSRKMPWIQTSEIFQNIEMIRKKLFWLFGIYRDAPPDVGRN
jgi:hypothetical protein